MPQETLGIHVALVVLLHGRFAGPDVDPHQEGIEKGAMVQIQGIIP